jgi:RHS repeat-associated protein
VLGAFGPPLAKGALSQPAVDNPIGWDGYVFDRESGLYTVRFRTYETGLGRWIERDPVGYVDGMTLFQYVRSAPSFSSDPFGLAEVCGPRVWMFTGEWCTDERIWEAAYEKGSEVVHDMAQGYGDAMGVEDLLKTGHTFDPRDRARGKCYARCLFWGTVEKVLLSELKSAALSGTMGLTGSVADFLTEFSVCDMAIESATFDFKKLLDVPGLVEDISGAFEKYAKRQLEIGFEQRIKRRDPLRAPGQSLAKARREARVAMKDFANQMGKLKEGFGLLSEGIKWADNPWEMSKVIDKCYSECADNPCQSPCAIIKKIN